MKQYYLSILCESCKCFKHTFKHNFSCKCFKHLTSIWCKKRVFSKDDCIVEFDRSSQDNWKMLSVNYQMFDRNSILQHFKNLTGEQKKIQPGTNSEGGPYCCINRWGFIKRVPGWPYEAGALHSLYLFYVISWNAVYSLTQKSVQSFSFSSVMSFNFFNKITTFRQLSPSWKGYVNESINIFLPWHYNNAPPRFINKLHALCASYIIYLHVSTSQNIWLTQNKFSQVLQTLTI